MLIFLSFNTRNVPRTYLAFWRQVPFYKHSSKTSLTQQRLTNTSRCFMPCGLQCYQELYEYKCKRTGEYAELQAHLFVVQQT